MTAYGSKATLYCTADHAALQHISLPQCLLRLASQGTMLAYVLRQDVSSNTASLPLAEQSQTEAAFPLHHT